MVIKMSVEPDALDKIVQLAERHLNTCERVYTAAMSRNDTDLAAHVARSALAVALNCAVDLRMDMRRETALTWSERLSDLYLKADMPSDYLLNAVKQAAKSIIGIFPEMLEANSVSSED